MEPVGRLVPFLLLDSPDLQIAAPALETVPSQVADGAQALKRAGDGQDFTINPPEN